MGDWYKVNYKKIRGYVKKEQVEIIKQSSNNDKNSVNSNYTNEQSQNTNENTVNQNTVTGEQPTTQEENKNEQEKETLDKIQVGEKLYTKGELQVYLRPLPTSMKMEKLTIGTEVTVVDVTCNWIYISVNGKTGWIRKELLTKTKDKNENKTEKEHAN